MWPTAQVIGTWIIVALLGYLVGYIDGRRIELLKSKARREKGK